MAWLTPLAIGATALRAQPGTTEGPATARTVRMRVTTQTDGRTPFTSATLVREVGRQQRIDRLQRVTDSVGRDWVLADSGTVLIRLISPAQRRIQVVRWSDLRTVYREELHLSVDSSSTVVERLGPGDRLLGRTTTRVRIRTALHLRGRRGTEQQAIAITRETEAHIDTTQAPLAGAAAISPASLGDGATILHYLFGNVPAAVVRRSGTLPDGLTLRSVSRTQTTSIGSELPSMPQRGVSETVQRVEVVSLEPRTVDPALFRAPTDFTESHFALQLRRLIESTRSASTPAPAGPPATKP